MTQVTRSDVSYSKAMYAWLIVVAVCTTATTIFSESPSVMQNELSQSFHINAYQFGTLAAFITMPTPMQIPAGMIYDQIWRAFCIMRRL